MDNYLEIIFTQKNAIILFVLGVPIQLIVFLGFKIKATITFAKKGKRKLKKEKSTEKSVASSKNEK